MGGRGLTRASLRVLGHSPLFARRGLFGHQPVVVLDLLEPGLAFRWYREGERALVELKWEDAYVSIKTVLGHLQISFPWPSYQLPVLQDQNIVRFLACLRGRNRE